MSPNASASVFLNVSARPRGPGGKHRDSQRAPAAPSGGLTPRIIEKNDSDLFFEWTATLVGFSPGVQREEEGGRRREKGGGRRAEGGQWR